MFLMNKEEEIPQKENHIEMEIAKEKLNRGIIVLNDAFDSKLYEKISTMIDYLVYTKKRKDILIEINSPGGVITDGMAIYDKIKSVEKTCRVHTVVTGIAASMGAALLTMGTSGCRYTYPHSTVMIHQPLSGYGVGTKISDLRRSVHKTLKIKELLLEIMSQTSNISYAEMERACDRDNYMNASEALEMGLVDKVITEIPDEFLC